MPEPRPSSPPNATRRRVGAALVAAALALFAPLAVAPAAHAAVPAATFTLTLSTAQATEGDTLVATVTGADISDLYAYDLVLTVTGGTLKSADGTASGPDGGFTSVTQDARTITVSHTRLGTSPGLSGTFVLATVPLRATGAGSTSVTLTSVRLVSPAGETATQKDVVSAPVQIAPPSPGEPSASPVPSASGSATPSPSASLAPAVSGSADLATTGVDATPWLISGAVGIALLAAGALLVVRRRQGVRE